MVRRSAFVLALLAVGLVAGCGGGHASGTSDLGSAKPFKPTAPQNNGDPDSQAASGVGAGTTLSSDGHGHFTLRVQNQSAFGVINNFSWVPPPSITITAVSDASRGTCRLSDRSIACSGPIPAPTCTCKAGPSLVIHFSGRHESVVGGSAVGYAGGQLHVAAVTPVPHMIPQTPQPTVTGEG